MRRHLLLVLPWIIAGVTVLYALTKSCPQYIETVSARDTDTWCEEFVQELDDELDACMGKLGFFLMDRAQDKERTAHERY